MSHMSALPSLEGLDMYGHTPPVKQATSECFVREVILCHLYRSPQFLESVLENPYMPVVMSHPTLSGVWTALESFYTKYRAIPSPSAICAELQMSGDFSQEELAWFYATLTKWVNFPENQLTVDFAQKILTDLLQEAFQNALTARIRDSNPNDLSGLLSGAATELAAYTTTDRIIPKNPFWGNPEDHLIQAAKVPFGVDWVDRALGGGSRPGELTGFVMPSKAGKTTLVWQFAEAKVMQEQNVVIYSFEQPLEGDQSMRAFVRASEATRSDWAVGKLAEIPEEARRRFDKNKDLWAKHLIVIDAWTDPNRILKNVQHMFQPINDLIAKNWYPKFVEFDWWGMMSAMLQMSAGRLTDMIARMQERIWIKEISGYLNEYGAQGVLFHQKTGAANKRGAGFIGSSHDAQGDSNFNNLLHHCFVSSRKDSDDKVLMKLDVSRDSGNPTIQLLMDAQRCLMTALSPEYDLDPNLIKAGGMGANTYDTDDVYQGDGQTTDI